MAFFAESTAILSHQRSVILLQKIPGRPKTTSTPKYHQLRNFSVRSGVEVSRCRGPVFAEAQIFETSDPQDDYLLAAAPSVTKAAFDCDSWQKFAEKVSGEWDGFGAEFSKDGKPVELPESVVPAAYREWEVKVFDWQTQCPTLCLPCPGPNDSDDGSYLLSYKLIKLLPTVGCEADAATTYSVDHRSVPSRLPTDIVTTNTAATDHLSNSIAAFAYQSSGCYVAVWGPVGLHEGLLELEHCLVDPRDKDSRVRIIQVLRVLQSQENSSTCSLELVKIQVFCEQWYGPFRNGDQLGGCSIRDSAFAATQPLDTTLLTAVSSWEGHSARANFHNSCYQESTIQELVDEGMTRTKSILVDIGDVTVLPKQLWCSVKPVEQADGETCFEVGWLLEPGRVITSSCLFVITGQLKEVAIAHHTAAT